jgi:hypothetical protein
MGVCNWAFFKGTNVFCCILGYNFQFTLHLQLAELKTAVLKWDARP